jgi:gold/copper resistance efflux pump
VAVFAGMLGVTLFGLLLTPVFYVLIRRLTVRRATAAAPLPAISTGTLHG